MKKLILFLVPLLAFGLILTGFNPQQNEANSDKKIVKGVDVVLTTVKDFKELLENSPKERKKIHQFGKKISEQWDVIEKQVEAKYPTDYQNIEESLYPLIALSQEEEPYVKKILELSDQVIEKLALFKGKISS